MRQNYARVVGEIDFQRGVGLEEAAQLGVEDKIDTEVERVLADGLGDVIPELKLPLIGLLWNVGIGSKPFADVIERHVRYLLGAVDDIVPELISKCEAVHQRTGQHGIQSRVSDLEMVLREVAACEIAEAIRLVVVAIVLLRCVADIGRFFVVESVV